MRTSTGPSCGASNLFSLRRTSDKPPTVSDSRNSGTYTSREPYRTPRTTLPSPVNRGDDSTDTGATPRPVDPYKCSTESSPERPSTKSSPPREKDTTGESTQLDIRPSHTVPARDAHEPSSGAPLHPHPDRERHH